MLVHLKKWSNLYVSSSLCVYACGVYSDARGRERETEIWLVGALCAYFHNHCSRGSPKLYEGRVIETNLKLKEIY